MLAMAQRLPWQSDPTYDGRMYCRAFPVAVALAGLPSFALAQPAPPAGTISADVPRTQFIATMDAEFRRQDLNGDGRITRAEVEQIERNALLASEQARNRALFAQLDADRNGTLSSQEFARLVSQPSLPDVAPTMARFDGNRDQVITLVEYRAATLANFDRLDADHDGVVTAAEMRAGGVAPVAR
jgi:Ca2+-binding EF-hand superfamily protein